MVLVLRTKLCVNWNMFYFPDKRKFELQYAQLYAVRLIMMRPKLVKASERHWGSKCDIKPLADIKENEKCVIIGTLFRKMELQPSILKEISIQGGVLPLPPSNKYIGKEDQLILEEEDQRIALTGDLDFSTAITGTVMAVYGYETDSGKFCVEDHCFVDRLLRNNEVLDGPIQNGEDRFVVFLSGLGIGSKKEDSLKLQLLVDLLSGRLASREEHRKFANVCRVIIAGNSLSRDTQDRDSEKTAKYLSRNTEAKTVVAMKRLDEILFELSSSVPVDIMPGEYDPTNQFLPQQPLHKCMFSKSARNETVQSVPNPYEAMVGGRRILGTSGQNVSNIYQFSGYTDRIEILESTLRRGHISPTSPDTLSCYPYYKEDPFVLNECPNIYFAGNQPKFEVKKITYGDDQEVTLLSIPSFEETGIAVLANLRDFSCTPLLVDTTIY